MIQRIEELSMNAFPALYTVHVNGWILRFSDGYSKRANSVNPLYDCSTDIKKNIELCDDMFKANHLDTVFKLTEKAGAHEIDRLLDEQGYTYQTTTNIMLRDITGCQITEQERKGVVIYNDLRDDWFEAYVHMNNISDRHVGILKKILQCIQAETYYGCIVDNGVITAVGLGVAERGYVGMYNISVDREKRRKGLGTKIMKNLMYEVSRKGHTYSYLQVAEANEGARILYEKLGYEKQYSYWYRVKKFSE